ncbi:MAG: hypothetical protein ACLRM8_01620 [Alistipes sp.]
MTGRSATRREPLVGATVLVKDSTRGDDWGRRHLFGRGARRGPVFRTSVTRNAKNRSEAVDDRRHDGGDQSVLRVVVVDTARRRAGP